MGVAWDIDCASGNLKLPELYLYYNSTTSELLHIMLFQERCLSLDLFSVKSRHLAMLDGTAGKTFMCTATGIVVSPGTKSRADLVLVPRVGTYG
jgi:hypothetical protein